MKIKREKRGDVTPEQYITLRPEKHDGNCILLRVQDGINVRVSDGDNSEFKGMPVIMIRKHKD